MKKSVFPRRLPVLTAGLGAVGLALRRLLYALAADEWGLLPQAHPLEGLLWLVSVGALALIGAVVWGLDGSARYVDNFAPSPAAAAGHVLAAAGIAAAVLFQGPPMEGGVGTAWLVMGLISVPCLLAAGLARLRGRRPFFGLHLAACLFLVIHIVNLYRSWSGDPQLLDYVFSLFGLVCLMFFGYYTAAFDVGLGKRRMQLFMGLTAVYLNLAGLEWDGYALLRLGGTVWAFTDLCSLTPKPKPPKPEQEAKTNGPA